MNTIRRAPVMPFLALPMIALVAALAACGPGATASPQPSASASPAASSGPVTSAEVAAALVLAIDSRFAGLKPSDPNLIGGCCFYEVTPSGDGYEVKIEIGWGDCPAGCINRHHWFYKVTRAGAVTLDREDGPPVPAGIPATGGGDAGVFGIRGLAVAGPTCPVVSVNDPNCAGRPVAGAAIHISDATGVEVAQLLSDASGAFVVSLAPGTYRLKADPVAGLMGTPDAVEVIVGATMAVVQLDYDTGIR